MAAYLSLKHKTTGEVFTGAKLIDLDEMLCKHLGVEPDKSKWCHNWMDWAGFMLALGQTKTTEEALAPVREGVGDDKVAIIDWFVENFDNNSFMGR